MREMVALLLGVALIAAGWEKSYKDHCIVIASILSSGGGVSVPQQAAAPVTPTGHTDPSWMYKKSALDSTKQSGVDRSGVHTNEPLLRQTQ